MRYKPYSIIIACISIAIGVFLTLEKLQKTDDGWITCSPSDVNMDARSIDNLVKNMHSGSLGKLDALVVVKDGKLVVDEYENNYNSDKVHTIQSDTKSITSMLIGIAIDQGKITSVDNKAVDYFKGYDIQNLDEKKKAIRIADLLTMRGGFDWDEFATPMNADNPVTKLYNSPDWLRTSIDAPMKFDPGTVFQYDSGGVMILDHILQESTGMHADAFAQKYLFGPLGINRYYWAKKYYVAGMPHTGGGLYMRPRDLAKIGQLVLDKGKWNGKQIVSEAWLNESLKVRVEKIDQGPIQADYGYLWWLFPNPGDSGQVIPACMGYGGQFVFIIPQRNMVVVTSASEFGENSRAMDICMEILYG